MGIIAKSFTFSAGGTVTHSELNTNYDTLYTEFNGNIDNTNIKANANIHGSKLANNTITASKLAAAAITDSKLDYTSVKVLRAGPSAAGANGVREARGNKAFNLGGVGSATVTITFATESDDGDPAFSSIPRINIGLITSGSNVYTYKLIATSVTAFTIVVNSTVGADAATGSIDWTATGDI